MNFDICYQFVQLMKDPSVKRMFQHLLEDLANQKNDFDPQRKRGPRYAGYVTLDEDGRQVPFTWDVLVDILGDNYSEWCLGYTEAKGDHQRYD